MLAVQLVARGYRVFAGCLTPEGVEALRPETQNSDKLTAFKLDVTKQEDIAACADRIRAACPDGLEYGAPRPPTPSAGPAPRDTRAVN